ncbi:3-keto-5-aminohexanoate cleavage protein [Nocardia sp. NBC_00508]|uniref:3-keto-5-aminohexanoate cleavage protein n=1 Tax=Nocardia sp. NBC_00508 TaxID=2975992 RepID=UPI002E81C785|nr:3-keto-5-aminohexanoate cleavage protein [Nocardia sp. NBC_00508]WUD65185.1 3-keto-5-aminohexanoate cleavage protein [Nocardia sp. NBC_00508]
MKKLIISVHPNEGAMRAPNPHVPWTADEIARDAAAARDAGAAMMHFHARTTDGGADHSTDGYARTIRAIRERTDLLLAPSLANAPGATITERLANIVDNAHDPMTRADFLSVDVGCANLDRYDWQGHEFRSTDRVFVNDVGSVARVLRTARELAMKPLLASFNISWTRSIEALLDAGEIEEPAFVLLVLGGPEFVAAHPGTTAGLDAHLGFLPAGKQIEWAVSVHAGNVLDVATAAIERGGHVAIGLGDYPHLELGAPTNPELVALIRDMARERGRAVATPAEAAEMLGMPPARPRLVIGHGRQQVAVMDSVSYASRADAGRVIVTGSHGGASAGEYARRFTVSCLVANDAGFGKNNAGIRGLEEIDADAIAGVAVGHESARIGDGTDVWEHGVITFVNDTARRQGYTVGARVQNEIRRITVDGTQEAAEC